MPRTTSSRRRRVGRLARLALLLAMSAGAGAQPAAPVATDSGEVPLLRHATDDAGGWIELEVSLGGHTGRWLLDTGAATNLVSPALAARLGLAGGRPRFAETAAGRLQGREVRLPALQVGALSRQGQSAVVLPLSALLGEAAEGFDGILGVPWLEGLRAEFDLRRWRARFDTHQAMACPEGLQPVALTRYRRLPVVRVTVDGQDEAFVLDTGNPAALLRVEAQPPAADAAALPLPGNGTLSRVAQVQLGGITLRDVPVLRRTAPALKAQLGELRGMAGVGLLDGARWHLDLAGERLCTEQQLRQAPGGFGLLPQRQGDGLVVHAVLPGSPADRAGVKVGEVIHRWAGRAASASSADLWGAVHDRALLALSIGAPPRELVLRRAVFLPLDPAAAR